jgi:hypothetical protein
VARWEILPSGKHTKFSLKMSNLGTHWVLDYPRSNRYTFVMAEALPISPPVAVNRLERFRALRAKLDPAGDPKRALDGDMYVGRETSLSKRLAASLLLAPNSTHLLLGGIGSGKTTELLAAQRTLAAAGDILALYIDVSQMQDVSNLTVGSVLVQANLQFAGALAERFPRLAHSDFGTIQQHYEHINDIALGYTLRGYDISAYEDFGHDEDVLEISGVLSPPNAITDSAACNGRDWMKKSVKFAKNAEFQHHVIVLLDGLDRVTDVAAFERVVQNDVRVLSQLSFGVVLAGPIRAQYGIDRTIFDQFNEVHHQPCMDIDSFSRDDEFLEQILRRRMSEDDLTDVAKSDLVRGSGGVLRDLMSLAQSACVEAYMDGSDIVDKRHVAAAIESFGRRQMQGLRSAELQSLKRLLTANTFVETSEDDLALLMTRRVLEYRTKGRPRFAVHPTIVRFIQELSAA